MSAVNFTRFSNVEALRKIHPHLLRELLKPHVSYFASRGYDIVEDEGLSYRRLSEILLLPDGATPTELVEALYLSHEMGTRRGLDAIIDELGEQCPAETRKFTPLDVAVMVYLANPDTLERLHNRVCVLRRRTFVCFRAEHDIHVPATLTEDQCDRMVERLDDFYDFRNRGRHCRLNVFPYRQQLWLTIRHGDAFRREVDVENKVTFVFRPECYSTVVLDGERNEIRINATTEQEVNMYREVVGELLFGDRETFLDSGVFTLAPLYDGPACMATTDIPWLDSAKLVDVKYEVVTSDQWVEEIVVKSEKSDDLFRTCRPGALVPEDADIIEATFSLRIRRAGERKVTIRKPNRASFSRDSDCAQIEQWLRARGFITPMRGDAPRPDNVTRLDEYEQPQPRPQPMW